MAIKIKCFGWRNPQLDQISRIEDGFRQIGCELVDENPDIIYSHDFSDWDNAYLSKLKYPDAKYLQKVLDIPVHIVNTPLYNLEQNTEKLQRADIILSNSITVHQQTLEFFKMNSHVIYDTIKDISYLSHIKKDIDFLIIGRNSDPNKRGYIFENLIMHPDNYKKSFAVVGPEPLPHIRYGYLGIIDDEALKCIYNATKFTICCSKNEGLNLIIPEACCGGSIPIIASDMSTCNEWNLTEFTVEPDIESINNKIKEINNNYEHYQQIALSYGEIFKVKFSSKSIAQRIVDIYKKYV